VAESDLYLDPEAAFAAAQALASEQGESLPVSPRTLGKRLCEAKQLLTTDQKRGRLVVRHTLEGKRVEVWHLHAGRFLGVDMGAKGASQAAQP
jgi:hypothetical protein